MTGPARSGTGSGPVLRIVYRSYGGENLKGRPDWYSKHLGLLSLLRAVERVGPHVEILYANDGPIPASRLELMAATGDMWPMDAGSNRRSYRAVIGDEAARPGPADGLVWFAEDDYLYRPDALETLIAGAAAMPEADYLTLYGWECLDTDAPRRRPRPRSSAGATGEPLPTVAGGATWYRAFTTASTFGVRRGVLREDVTLLRIAPFTGGAWDGTSSLMSQGLAPFSGSDLLDDLRRRDSTVPRVRSIGRAAVRAGACARSLRRPSRCRSLLGTDPEMIHHMELPEAAPRTPRPRSSAVTRWAGLAAETWRWAEQQGLCGSPAKDRTP